MKKYYCYTCGKSAVTKSTVYAYDEQTGKPLINTWRECSAKSIWERWFELYHPVTRYEGLPYDPGV